MPGIRTRACAAMAVLALAASLGGCASTETVVQSHDGTLVVTVPGELGLPQEVADRFEQSTGISVQVRSQELSALDLRDLVGQDVGADAIGDVAIGLPTASRDDADPGRGLLPYTSPAAGDGAGDYQFATSDRLTAVTVDYVCAAADAAWLEGHSTEVPDVSQLGAGDSVPVALADPDRSASALAFLGMLSDGLAEQGQASLGALTPQTVKVADEVSSASTAGGGSAPIVVGSWPRLITALPDAGLVVVPSSCAKDVRYAGIVSRSPHATEAKLFIDFLLESEQQASLRDAWSQFPVTRGVDAPAAWDAAPEAWGVSSFGRIDLAYRSGSWSSVLTAWHDAFGILGEVSPSA